MENTKKSELGNTSTEVVGVTETRNDFVFKVVKLNESKEGLDTFFFGSPVELNIVGYISFPKGNMNTEDVFRYVMESNNPQNVLRHYVDEAEMDVEVEE